VQYLIWIAFLAACGLLAVLSYFDISPKSFLYRVSKRFMAPSAGLKPVLRDAPYRRTESTGTLHRPTLLNLQTSDGSGQACHPDVFHVPEGFGSGKWPYWMVCTPYPYQNEYFENPEIFVSRDGISWSIPQGLQNPVARFPRNISGHHSDPDFLLFREELWLFYRSTIRSRTPRETPDENKLYLTKSANGVRWSQPLEVLSEHQGAQLLSPAVIQDGTQFVMWTMETETGTHQLKRRTSANGVTWSLPTICEVVGLKEGRQPWHVDVIQEEDRLSALLVSCTGPGGAESRIHYAYSVDQGLTWFANDFLFEKSYEFESKLQYRASLRKLREMPHIYELWYSACSQTDVFSIASLKVVREQNTLLPCEEQSAEYQTLTSEKQTSFMTSVF
jgi:hypothetical protein